MVYSKYMGMLAMVKMILNLTSDDIKQWKVAGQNGIFFELKSGEKYSFEEDSNGDWTLKKTMKTGKRGMI